MTLRIYGIEASHPCHAVRKMAELKEIDHRMVWLPPGLHPAAVRLLGFHGATVPAARIDGRRVQNSRRFAAEFERIAPSPALFPAGAAERAAVESAEEWGESVLQPVPTQLIRWMAVRHRDVGAILAADAGMPAPRLTAVASIPVARHMANRVGAGDEGVRGTLARLPAMFDHVDGLIEAGVVGGSQPNAADFQIGATLRVMLEIEDIAPAVARRAGLAELAERILPDYPGSAIPAHLPREWLEPLRA